MNSIFLTFKNQFRKFIYLIFLFPLASCMTNYSMSPQLESINGLSMHLKFFEETVIRKEYSLLLETFYVQEHAEQVNNKYANNISKWLKKNEVSKFFMNGSFIQKRFFCPLAYRRKNVSKRFSPQYIIYYNFQSMPCLYINTKDAGVFHYGQMEWGYEYKKKRWIHLRKLD